MIILLFVLLVLLAVCLLGMLWINGARGRERADRRAIRTGDLYAEVLTALNVDPRRPILSLSVSCDEVVLKYLDPDISPRVFRMRDAGFEPLQQRFVLAMTHALAVDLPVLQDENRYHLVEKRRRSEDGMSRIAYVYELNMETKTALMKLERWKGEDEV